MASENVKEFTDQNFDTEVLKSDKPVLVDFWAEWCGPCRMIAPGVERAARELAGELKVVKVNVDESPRVATRFAAQSIPLLYVLRGGTPVARQVGALPADRLLAWARSAVDAGRGAP